MANEKRLIDIDNLIDDLGCSDFDISVKELLESEWLRNQVHAVELPCKVGHMVFFVCAICDEEGKERFSVLAGEIVSFSMQKEGLWAYCRYEDGLTYWHNVDDDFDQTVFLTKKAAEAALAKMDGDGNG